MKYQVSHITRYQYRETASLSHNELFLTPRQTPAQRCTDHTLTLSPPPAAMSRRTDYFGNGVTATTVQVPHALFEITARSRVELHPPPAPVPEQTAPWEQVIAAVRRHGTPEDLDAFQYVFPSPMIPVSEDMARWAGDLFPPGEPFLRGASRLMERIFTRFTYDPGATSTTTPVAAAFELKRGVCQDFAHIAIACLRSLGLPARYVSGYLHTQPPPGKDRLKGAEASHAWFAVFLPGTGWVDLDPTNNVMPFDQHLTLAWGRDYSDVTPVKGTVLGGGRHQLSVAVDVIRTD
ncbi:MAG: transglutaminase family protein [Desulfotignum sp.]|nr:transglutaminase family protein [Desulfotignum sp.]MCF8089122.1 transglutaminase family protein [Desulfotignum sp.]MCF8138675.1 transglutaminase family protein [Desulfotignum sp.]